MAAPRAAAAPLPQPDCGHWRNFRGARAQPPLPNPAPTAPGPAATDAGPGRGTTALPLVGSSWPAQTTGAVVPPAGRCHPRGAGDLIRRSGLFLDAGPPRRCPSEAPGRASRRAVFNPPGASGTSPPAAPSRGWARREGDSFGAPGNEPRAGPPPDGAGGGRGSRRQRGQRRGGGSAGRCSQLVVNRKPRDFPPARAKHRAGLPLRRQEAPAGPGSAAAQPRPSATVSPGEPPCFHPAALRSPDGARLASTEP